MSDTVRLALTVNGSRRELGVAPWTTLLDPLREDLESAPSIVLVWIAAFS